MRRRIVAGNWKMNLDRGQAKALYSAIIAEPIPEGVELAVFPVALHVTELVELNGSVAVGVQNFYPEEKGAFTGEVSVAQVRDSGAHHVLIGHSERRALFGEDHDLLRSKVSAAINNGLIPVFCCGEPLEIRENGNEDAYVSEQLEASLFHLDKEQLKRCVIAYEPVWAIGTGKTATSGQAEAMHRSIRSWIAEQYDQSTADVIPILYGGSCNPGNAKELFACPNVDGGLIGGASLDAASFLQIARSF